MVGPFVFFDHFGPTCSSPQRLDVRPPSAHRARHRQLPVRGEIMHLDSLGTAIPIRPAR